jgi:hypothetical protein
MSMALSPHLFGLHCRPTQYNGTYSRCPRNFATTQIFCLVLVHCLHNKSFVWSLFTVCITNLLFGPCHCHCLHNKRFAWLQSCEGFVNMGSLNSLILDKVIVWSALRASREYMWLKMPVGDKLRPYLYGFTKLQFTHVTRTIS